MNAATPVPVVVCRFEDLVARGLAVLIEEEANLELVARDVPHERLGEALERHAPRVAIVNFGSLRSPTEVNEVHQSHPETHLVVLANCPTPSECSQILAFGATACLSKDTQARDILNALHLASRGLNVLPRAPDAPPSPEPSGPRLLTPREADVLGLLQDGRSNAEIAAALHVGVETVRTHARNIYRKLGVSTRRDLASLPAAAARRTAL